MAASARANFRRDKLCEELNEQPDSGLLHQRSMTQIETEAADMC
jgi:hypothetical protein